jgi:Leucine-rich repeat (LRR) protein
MKSIVARLKNVRNAFRKASPFDASRRPQWTENHRGNAGVRRVVPWVRFSSHAFRWRLLILSSFAITLTAASVSQAIIPNTERAVLQALYNNTNGASWTNKAGWNGAIGTECSWFGVTCAANDAHVTQIQLNRNNLDGTLPTTLNQLVHLETFSVPENKIRGVIPTLTGLNTLRAFIASYNQLTGSIPALTGFATLKYLFVSNNALIGSVPTISGSSTLLAVDVSANQLTGPIPTLINLPSLQELFVSDNKLTGSIPPLDGLPALQRFAANNNDLSGAIPSLAGLPLLQSLALDHNRLTGSIPSLAGLSRLSSVRVNDNLLSGTLPTLDGLSQLFSFDASRNLLRGSIPSLAGLSTLNAFIVSNNQLTGSIPPLAGLSALTNFNVSLNQLTGPIPPLAGLSALQGINVSFNQLNGTIPAVPSPSSLIAAGSRLCPNQLVISSNAAWDAATPFATWDVGCTSERTLQILNFGAAPVLIFGGSGQVKVTVSPIPSSSQPIAYFSLTPNVCSVNVNTGFVNALSLADALGTVCTITADKADDAFFNSATQIQQSITVSTIPCRLDVNDDSFKTAEIDGLLILRYMLGLRGSELTAGLVFTGRRTTPQDIETFLSTQDYDVRGNKPPDPLATRDGFVISRHLRSLSATATIAGTDIPPTEAEAVRNVVTGWCPP